MLVHLVSEQSFPLNLINDAPSPFRAKLQGDWTLCEGWHSCYDIFEAMYVGLQLFSLHLQKSSNKHKQFINTEMPNIFRISKAVCRPNEYSVLPYQTTPVCTQPLWGFLIRVQVLPQANPTFMATKSSALISRAGRYWTTMSGAKLTTADMVEFSLSITAVFTAGKCQYNHGAHHLEFISIFWICTEWQWMHSKFGNKLMKYGRFL